MENTSYVSVKAEELQTACELWLDARKERIKNKIQKEIESAMLVDRNSWWKKLLKFKPKYLTQEEAFEFIHGRGEYITLGMFESSIADWIENRGMVWQLRVEKILYACKVPHYGFVNLSIEDNSILEGYYEEV